MKKPERERKKQEHVVRGCTGEFIHRAREEEFV
jgi:hypothetical protein